MFTDMVRADLSETEKTELKMLLEQQKAGTTMTMETVKKVKAWELNNFEEFAKIVTKRKAMVEKLKVFMKDEKAFKYMCMNHWDELIAKLFADEKIVTKYKNILLKWQKSTIEGFYSTKWKDFEKIIHTAYLKNIESKNIKNISIIRSIELIIEDIKKWTMSDMVSAEFGDFTQFAKKNLTATQKEELNKILSDRKGLQEKVKWMLTEAKANWTFYEAFKKVEESRTNCKARFTPYVDESKVEDFSAHCKMWWEKLKAAFMN